MAKYTKVAVTQRLRETLRRYTTELKKAGVTGLVYSEDRIDVMAPSTLTSCIAWADETLKNIKSL